MSVDPRIQEVLDLRAQANVTTPEGIVATVRMIGSALRASGEGLESLQEQINVLETMAKYGINLALNEIEALTARVAELEAKL